MITPLPAMLVMVLFAFMPRRRRLLVLVAVIAWATVWIDNRLTADPFDLIGVLVAGAALGAGMLSPGPRTARSARGNDDRA